MKKTAVIMAGGVGSRFWPKSRISMPKQFLALKEGERTLIQQTVDRILPKIALEDIFIVTNGRYVDLVTEQLPNLPKENVLLEPVGKNTAPCIALAAAHIQKRYGGEAGMLVLPSDHLIQYEEMFLEVVDDAFALAGTSENLITIGITPSYPETGYGYIEFVPSKMDHGGGFEVRRFVEKPDAQTAKEYLMSGKYLWNSGMFVWKASTILENFKSFLPEVYEGVQKIATFIGTADYDHKLDEIYKELPSESIDFGIMEKSDKIYVFPGSFGWNDVGSWLSIGQISRADEDGNVIEGNVISIDVQNTLIQASDKLIAIIGVEDLIVVDTEDAILICNKDDTQDVKKVIENLKICNRNEYL